MAQSSITTTFSGHGNQGLQVGYNSGSIHVAAPERPETPAQPTCFVPFRRDADFVDRGTLLTQIRERCSTPASRVALVGLGGVGKSQLAIEHCYRTAEQSPGTWVFWAHASNTARLEQSFREIADQARVRGRTDPQANVFKLVHDWLRNAKNGPWLLVLDNADDAAILSPEYIPSSGHGSVLVTSRTKRAAMQVVEDSDIISIEPMHDAAAHALLYKKLRGIAEEDDAISELATTLDHMPLALVQAAAYIRERAPRCSVRQYLEEYQQSDSSKTSLLNQEAGHLRRDKAASNSVLITWQISFNHIRSTRPSAADLLSLMSFFDRQGIQESLLHRQTSIAAERELTLQLDDGFENDVLVLRDYLFIAVTRDAGTFEMHSLVQLATRTWLGNEGQLDKWREHFISNLAAELPTAEYENWEKCQALYPHARAALAQRPKDGESLKQWAKLLHNAAWYAWHRGRASEAEQMSVMSMEVASEVLGGEDEDTLEIMNIVGLAKNLGGKYKEAEAMHRQTLVIREKVLGLEHRETLSSRNNLATVLDDQGKYQEAETIHRQTLVIREKVLGLKHPHTLTSMNNLASVLSIQGKCEEAEMIYRKVRSLYEEVHGLEHPRTLYCTSNLALVLNMQGKEEAEVIYRQTLARMGEALGYEHPNTLMTVQGLARHLTMWHRYNEACALYDRAYTGLQAVLGKDHPITRKCGKGYDYLLELLESELAISSTSVDGSARVSREESVLNNPFTIASGSAQEDSGLEISSTAGGSSQARKDKDKGSKLLRAFAKLGYHVSKQFRS